MKIARYRIEPGGQEGQLGREQKIKLAEKYIELLKQTETIIDIERDDKWVTIKMEDGCA